jgi:hypothetical protein
MNAKFNKWFAETQSDPVRRRAAIADYTKRYWSLFCCATVITLCALFMLRHGTYIAT